MRIESVGVYDIPEEVYHMIANSLQRRFHTFLKRVFQGAFLACLCSHFIRQAFQVRSPSDYTYCYITKGPFVYRDGTGWPASLPYIRKIHVSVAIGTQSRICLHKRVPMVKIWGSSKKYQNRMTGKLLKL